MFKKTKLYFIENSFDYNGDDLNNMKIGGSEKTLINISNQLAKNEDLVVKVFNNTSNSSLIRNVHWKNIKEVTPLDKPDYAVAMSDANLLNILNSNNNYLWSHSIQSFEKFIRKKQLIPFIKHKPIMILEGRYHYKKRNFLTSFFGKKILKIAPDDDFINTQIDIEFIPPPNAIFTTKSDRNLDFLIKAWEEIRINNFDSKLFINPPYSLNESDKKNDIYVRTKGDKKLLIDDLKNSKVFITPGHKTEVFCLAAEEARELCLPIVTMGYGSLYERVEHGVTGFIAKNMKEFVNYTNLVLKDDTIYLELRKNLLKRKNSRNYNNVKDDFMKILKIYD